MKKVNKIPESGQFVAVWECNNNIWSATYKHINGALAEYDGEYFVKIDEDTTIAIQNGSAENVKYYIIKQTKLGNKG